MSHSEPQNLFDSKTEGKAVFFSPRAGKSFHFEPTALKCDFSHQDGNPKGRFALKGIFRYHKKFFSQIPEYPIKADFCASAKRVDRNLHVNIAFYAPGTGNDLLGEFLAKDLDNILAGFEGRNDRLSGDWKPTYLKTQGKAVFFSPYTSRSFYFEPTALKRYFSYRDGNPGGRLALYGTFQYHRDFLSEIPEHSIEANFRALSERVDGNLHAKIVFYAPGSRDDLLGEFLARDPENVIAGFMEKDDLLSGNWDVDVRAETQGEAMFFSRNRILFRFDVPALRWMFFYCDTSHGGEPVLYGTFHYNKDFFSKFPEPWFEADFRASTERVDNTLYARIVFYTPGSGSELLGEFFARDPEDALAVFEPGKDKRLPGRWMLRSY